MHRILMIGALLATVSGCNVPADTVTANDMNFANEAAQVVAKPSSSSLVETNVNDGRAKSSQKIPKWLVGAWQLDRENQKLEPTSECDPERIIRFSFDGTYYDAVTGVDPSSGTYKIGKDGKVIMHEVTRPTPDAPDGLVSETPIIIKNHTTFIYHMMDDAIFHACDRN
jgi:hypothetical protein